MFKKYFGLFNKAKVAFSITMMFFSFLFLAESAYADLSDGVGSNYNIEEINKVVRIKIYRETPSGLSLQDVLKSNTLAFPAFTSYSAVVSNKMMPISDAIKVVLKELDKNRKDGKHSVIKGHRFLVDIVHSRVNGLLLFVK